MVSWLWKIVRQLLIPPPEALRFSSNHEIWLSEHFLNSCFDQWPIRAMMSIVANSPGACFTASFFGHDVLAAKAGECLVVQIFCSLRMFFLSIIDGHCQRFFQRNQQLVVTDSLFSENIEWAAVNMIIIIVIITATVIISSITMCYFIILIVIVLQVSVNISCQIVSFSELFLGLYPDYS